MRFLRSAKSNRKLRANPSGVLHHAYTAEAIRAKDAVPSFPAGDETPHNRSVQPGPHPGQRMTSDH